MSRFVVLLVLVQLALRAADAKVVSVTGGIRQMGPGFAFPYPANTFSQASDQPNDSSSPLEDTTLLIGVFDEKTGVVPSSSITLSNGAVLNTNQQYDSFYVFFHQKYPGSGSRVASGTITTDNRVVGCTSSDGFDNDGNREIATTPLFGLTSDIQYQLVTQGNRGFEGGDLGVGVGTTVSVNLQIVQPGDYTRCFTPSCGETCTCGAEYATTFCLPRTAEPYCVPDITALTNLPETTLSFSSTCEVSPSSVHPTLNPASCVEADGCTISPAGICLDTSRTHHLQLRVTAGCGCDIADVPFTVGPCDPCETGHYAGATGLVDATGKCACLAP